MLTAASLAGLGLPQRWRGRARFVVLDTGFGDGTRVLQAWAAWQQDADRCGQLHLISIDSVAHGDATEWRLALREAHIATPLEALASQFADALPPPTANLHRLAFEGGRVQVLLALGDLAFWLTELVAQVDAIWLDGLVGGGDGELRHLKAVARLAAPGATVWASSTSSALRDGLRTAGFVSIPTDSTEPTDTPTTTRARYAPPFVPRRAPARAATAVTSERRAVIVGGGLAGCACAQALAEHGWHSTVVDRHAEPAREASGNPAGLFHGIVNPQDGAHARFNRAAALEAQRAVTCALRATGADTLRGGVRGLLRLETAATLEAMRSTLQHLRLPADYVQAVGAEQASALSGLRLLHAAWFYPGGGWVDPAALARAYLAQAGTSARWLGGTQVQRLERRAAGWAVLDANDTLIAEVPVVVLANAAQFSSLLVSLGQPPWPLQQVRGQISVLRNPSVHGLTLPHIPVAGAGYLLPEVDGSAVFGATSQPGDDDPDVRDSDHGHNLAQLARLTGAALATPDMLSLNPHDLQGRTAWRCVSDDRLPLIGAVPDALAAAGASRLDQPRFVPRLPGLFVFTGLGSRGITWSALGAQVLASWVSGAPAPVEAGLIDAVDPARFISRAARRPPVQR